MMNPTKVLPNFDVHKNDFTIIRVEHRTHKDLTFIDIRQFYRDDDGEFKPTPKGITCQPDKLSDLINVLTKMKNELGRIGR